MPALLTPAQLIQNLLHNSEPAHCARVLERTRLANQSRLTELQAERLHVEESGWVDYWSSRYEHTTELLALIEQALASC